LKELEAQKMTEDVKIEFAPGAFDDFEGTQEELDELVNEIRRLVSTGELFENSQVLDIDEFLEEEPELAEKLISSMENVDGRNLQ
jgi:uncharacterized protein YqgV (UPF0045/DUF77 family)